MIYMARISSNFSGVDCGSSLDSNEEAINNEVNSIAIVFFHKKFSSHVALSVDDSVSGFACFYSTQEPDSLRKAVRKRIRNQKATTVQFLSVTHAQKQKIQRIVAQKKYPCLTCMHAVSRILAETTDIKILPIVNLFPNLSLVYLNSLQQQGKKTLLKQRTIGDFQETRCKRLFSEVVCGVFVPTMVGCVAYLASRFF